MGYYCTVPQCTSLAGKTKNVKFHRFPRDVTMADKWNVILKRGKPYTKYSKVCSLHFTQADYNVTTMGQWKTLSKDAVPSQNLPKLNPDGTVMVIRKSRTVKYKDGRKDDNSIDKTEKWSSLAGLTHVQSAPISTTVSTPAPPTNLSLGGEGGPHIVDAHDVTLAYRLQNLAAIANHISPQLPGHNQIHQNISQLRPKKQDAIMQTDPLQNEEDESLNHVNKSHSESEASYSSELDTYSVQSQYQKNPKNYDTQNKNFEMPKDYTKSPDDYIPQTNEEYNKEAEKYALERKSHNGYEKPILDSTFQKTVPNASENGFQKQIENGYTKISEIYGGYNEKQEYNRSDGYIAYQNGFLDSTEILKNQQNNLQMLQQPHRAPENQNFFDENHIKREIDIGTEEEKFLYDRPKDELDANSLYREGQRRLIQQQRILEHLQHQLKQEPDAANGAYYDQVTSRPGPELLIAKQNALAAHTQLWQNTMKRPFFYSETHYNTQQLLHRYEDVSRILQ